MRVDGLINKISIMFAVLLLFLLALSPSCGAAEAELAPPRDLTVITLNTNYTLSWTWDQAAAEPSNVTFTTRYSSRYNPKKNRVKQWRTVCEETSQRSCDLTGSNLLYLGIFFFQVQANMDGRHSEWVQKEFCPDKEAAIGPPSSVHLAPAGGALDVFIIDPLTSTNSSMREHLPQLYFRIYYWEQNDESQVQSIDAKTNMVTLSDVKAWTWYCVSIQSRYDYYNKTSGFTSPQCVQTEGSVPWWQIVLYFLGSLLVCFLVVLLALYGSHWCYHLCKTTLFPRDQLPPHIKQRLFDSPGSDAPCLVLSDSESELLYDPVTVLEIHNPSGVISAAPPAGLEQDSSCRHGRQDSSSSGDSGVYSAGTSSTMQPNICPPYPDVKRGCKGCSDLEEVKMLKMESPFEFCPVIPVEEVSDVCV